MGKEPNDEEIAENSIETAVLNEGERMKRHAINNIKAIFLFLKL